MKAQQGFSLLELMAVLAVVGILLGIGVPSLVTTIQNSRVLAMSNDLVSAIHAGRAESVKRRAIIVLCASENLQSETAACSGEFGDGWILFVDRNGNGEVNANSDPALDDTVLLARKLAPGRLTVSSAGGDYIAFAPSGFARALPALGARATALTICDERGNVETTPGQSAARVLVAAGTGRPEILKSVDAVANYGGC